MISFKIYLLIIGLVQLLDVIVENQNIYNVKSLEDNAKNGKFHQDVLKYFP